MPDLQSHLDKAKANTEVYERLKDNGLSPDWQAVVLFYAAIHYVEAIAAISNIHNETHEKRELYIRNQLPLDFWTLYDMLRGESRKARYLSNAHRLGGNAWRSGAFTMDAEQVRKRLYEIALAGIRTYTHKQLPKAIPASPNEPSESPQQS